MTEVWRDMIVQAQQTLAVTIRGKSLPRTRNGEHDRDWQSGNDSCGYCGVMKGEFHVPFCEMERCLAAASKWVVIRPCIVA
jgi:hypothetical protein